MKNIFSGYYKPTKEEFEHLWDNAIIILDANVLLNFYRFSKETTDKLFETVKKLQSRIWLPHKVAIEYHQNINTVISGQIKSCEKTLETLKTFKSQIDNNKNHPFLEPNLLKEINRFYNKFDKELTEKRDKIESLITNNDIKDRIATILCDNIGTKLTSEQLEKIYTEGNNRYSNKIPPGYMDRNKQNEGNYKLYGDLIIWKDILKKIFN